MAADRGVVVSFASLHPRRRPGSPAVDGAQHDRSTPLSKPHPLKRRLFVAFSLLVLATSGTILVLSVLSNAQQARTLSLSLIERTQRQTEGEVHRLFDPITQAVAVSHRWVQDGLVKRYDSEALKRLFLPQMMLLPQCVSMMVSDMAGYEFLLLRNDSEGLLAPVEGKGRWVTRDFRRDAWGKRSLWALWNENGDTLLREWERELDYDPRPRVWHKGARDRYRPRTTREIVADTGEAVHWTDIDIFFTSKTPGLTASVAVEDPSGELVVLGYDLLLSDLTEHTQRLTPTPQGKVFVMTDEGQLLGLPRDPDLADRAARDRALLKPLEAAGIPVLTAAARPWRERTRDDLAPLTVAVDGEDWFVGFRPVPIADDRRLWVGVAIPEGDVLAAAEQEQWVISGIAGLAMLLAMGLAGLLSARFARPLQALLSQSHRIAELDLDERPPVRSGLLEVQALSDALDETRRALKRHIAERDRAEADRAASEARLRLLLQHFPGALWMVDEALAPSGLIGARADLLAEAVEAPSGEPDEASPAPVTAAYRCALGGQPASFELALGERLFAVHVEPLTGRERPAAIAVAHDITERRRADDERVEQRLREAQKLESLGLLAGGIAHDFNNLLVGILGGADLLLLEEPEGAPSRELLELIRTSAGQAAELTAQMLAYSGKGKFVVAPLDLGVVVGEMAGLLRAGMAPGVVLDLDVAAELPAVEADRSQLQQVVMNLVRNAADAIGDGGGVVTVRVELRDVAREELERCLLDDARGAGRYVVLEVADTGVGMGPQTRERMFDPFFTTKVTGHGLGLSASIGIVRGHRGNVRVVSELGAGTTITVLLPVLEGVEPGKASARQLRASQAAVGRQATVLVVDDNEQVRLTATAVLERAGYDVRLAADGLEALERHAEGSREIDLVLLDVTMPRLGGVETYHELKRRDPDVRVLFSSGYKDQEAACRRASHGEAAFIRKPYAVAELLEQVEAALVGGRAPRPERHMTPPALRVARDDDGREGAS